MFRIRTTVENPMTGESQLLSWQFDPATFGTQVYAKTFAEVKAVVDDLIAKSATSEPSKL